MKISGNIKATLLHVGLATQRTEKNKDMRYKCYFHPEVNKAQDNYCQAQNVTIV